VNAFWNFIISFMVTICIKCNKLKRFDPFESLCLNLDAPLMLFSKSNESYSSEIRQKVSVIICQDDIILHSPPQVLCCDVCITKKRRLKACRNKYSVASRRRHKLRPFFILIRQICALSARAARQIECAKNEREAVS
jgi:hypothetical protein